MDVFRGTINSAFHNCWHLREEKKGSFYETYLVPLERLIKLNWKHIAFELDVDETTIKFVGNCESQGFCTQIASEVFMFLLHLEKLTGNQKVHYGFDLWETYNSEV